MTNDIDLDDFDAPGKKDFRRIGRGIPYVVGLDGKRTRYSRSSNGGKILDDESNLVDWKLRTTVIGAAQRPDLMAVVSTLDSQADKKELRDIAEQCLVAGKGQERAIKGTAIHAMFDHIDLQHDWEPAPQYVAVCNAYMDCLDRYGLVAVDVEVKCINDDFRLAGTVDRRYRTMRALLTPDGRIVPIGSVIVADTKTGQTLEYASGSYSTQIAAYVDSVRYDVATDEREPFDPPNYPDWAIVVHADAELGTCDAYWVDVNAGREGLRLARMVKGWRKRTDLIVPATPPIQSLPSVAAVRAAQDGHPLGGAPTPPVPTGIPSPGGVDSGHEGPPVPLVPEPPAEVPGLPSVLPVVASDGPGDPNVREYVRERVAAILAHSPRAGKSLQLAWPVDVPGLKREGHTAMQLDAINEACERVEDEYNMGFRAPMPTRQASMEKHPSWVDKWSKPDGTPTPVDQRAEQSREINNHPRRALLLSWVSQAVAHGLDSKIDTYALSNALYEFASLDAVTWPDDDLTLMLDGSLRAMGYFDGINELGHFLPEHAPLLMSAAFAIAAGNALLLHDENEKPVLRTIAPS